MRARVSYFAFFLLLASLTSVQANEPKPYKMPRTQVVPIQNSEADRQYELYIKLPEGYSDNTDAKYPVIYMTDAVWHMDMLSGATEFLMPNVILVGISWQQGLDDEKAYVSRFRDYSVVRSNNPENQAKYQFGQASNHLPFIRNNVIKYIENNYRADPSERTYFGYSLGGQFGAYILLKQPDTFKNYVLGSPAFGRRGATYKYIDELEAKTAAEQRSLDVNVFVTLGELEQSKMEATKEFMSVLRRRSEAGLKLAELEIIENSNHTTAFPETAIRGVKWLKLLNGE